ncbi:hypothetical protein UR09_06310 [Candidatus Nitromaritima sp. SCGC AAA799-A02]|nr:hypothetical protein UR09_06310 [Candidatus Nitromaritima sp. SCGC AAA799-A02]
MSDFNPDIFRTESAEEVSFGQFFPLLEKVHGFFFYTRNAEGTIDSVCPRVVNCLGYSQKEFVKHYESYLIEEPNSIEGLNILRKKLEEDLLSSYIIGVINSNGFKSWLQMSETLIIDKGTVKAAKGVACDVTNLIHFEKKVEVMENRFREMSEASPIGIFQIDPDDNIVFLNTRCQSIFGKGLRLLLGQKWWEFIYSEDQEELFKQWADCESSGSEFSWEGRAQKPEEILNEILGWFSPADAVGVILVTRNGFAGGSNRSMAWSAGEFY